MSSSVRNGPSYRVLRPPEAAERIWFERDRLFVQLKDGLEIGTPLSRFPDRLFVQLKDGLEIGTPLSRFPLLQRATPEQRENWCISDFGMALHWPDIDEDISVAGLLGLSD